MTDPPQYDLLPGMDDDQNGKMMMGKWTKHRPHLDFDGDTLPLKDELPFAGLDLAPPWIAASSAEMLRPRLWVDEYDESYNLMLVLRSISVTPLPYRTDVV